MQYISLSCKAQYSMTQEKSIQDDSCSVKEKSMIYSVKVTKGLTTCKNWKVVLSCNHWWMRSSHLWEPFHIKSATLSLDSLKGKKNCWLIKRRGSPWNVFRVWQANVRRWIYGAIWRSWEVEETQPCSIVEPASTSKKALVMSNIDEVGKIIRKTACRGPTTIMHLFFSPCTHNHALGPSTITI